ncbi:MAG TPA: phosphatidate cytidylyltransferase [Acetobacteraceae bacterium]|nr:phosphatidate cytidylyltransferase [Acetobacteraceae bacterium]
MPALADCPTERWADLGIRVISALVLAPITIVCVWVGGVVFTVIVAAAVIGLAVEWLGLCRRSSLIVLRPAGLAYVILAGVAVLWLRHDPVAGRSDVLFLLSIVWAGDIGAYLVGRWIGGPRLAPHISPGKTWSGSVGGLLAAIAAGSLAAHFLSDAATWRAMLIAAALSVVAQAGDLLESFVKRRLQVKDSGHLIPGHGGLFDRLDGVLAAAPVAALLALTLGRGVVLWQ